MMKPNYIYITYKLKGPALTVKKICKKKYLKKNMVKKNLSPIGPAVWPTIRNIYIYECLVLLYR